jgi:hypothetical protein
MKSFLITFLILGGVVLGWFATRIFFFPVNTATKLIDTAYQAQDKVLNADNAIHNYEWFKQQYEDISAFRAKLDNSKMSYESFLSSMPKEKKDWTFEDKNEDARLRSIVLGAENNLEQLIANYNARAKMATRNIFENSVLPSYIDALTFIKK